MKPITRFKWLVFCLTSFWILTDAQAQELEWVRQLGTAQGDESWAVSADLQGNVYISGFTEGSLGGPFAGGYKDAFLSKYDASGNLQWTRQLGTASLDESTSVSTDSLGNVYIAGHTSGSLGGLNSGNYDDAFLSKYDRTGNLQWTRQLGTAYYDVSSGVSADPFGNVYISGTTSGQLGGPYAGSGDAFVSKFDASGNLIWTRQLGTSHNDSSRSVSGDSRGNVYISGNTFGSLGGLSAGMDDAFVCKYDASGNLQWTRQLGTAGEDLSFGVSADALGNVFISGYVEGGRVETGIILWDAFVTKYDSAGNLQWSRRFATADVENSNGVSADSLGNVFISGRTGWNFGPPKAYVSKYDGEGSLLWTRELGSADGTESNSVFADLLGNVYISGVTLGSLGGPNAGSYDAFVAKFSTIPEPGTLFLATLASVTLLLPRARRGTEITLISANPR